MSGDLDLGKMAKELMANLKERQDVAKRLAELESSITAGQNRLNHFLLEGETTGNELLDLVIRRRVSDMTSMNKYQELMERLIGKIGQIILVVTYEKYRWRHSCRYDQGDYLSKMVIRVGMLKGDQFIFSNGEYFFPVDTYLEYWGNESWRMESSMDLIYYRSNSGSLSERCTDPIVLIGEMEIDKWLEGCPGEQILRVRKSLEIMENPSLFSRQQEEKRKKKPEPFISVTKGKT